MSHFGLLAPIAASLISLCVALVTLAQASRPSSETPAISYIVSMSKPYTHLLEVEMRMRRGRPADRTDLVMPVWTPGSYLVREYARHVQEFAATDEQGRALEWSKTNKNTWRIRTNNVRELRVTYRVYANELTVRTNELNDTHAFWNNTALLMYPEGGLDQPSTVRVMPYDGWQVATGLPPVAGQPNSFQAENFDVLYDSPFEVGRFRTLSFQVRGLPHRIVICGEGNYDAERMQADVKKIVETTVGMMGDIPYRDYTFILHLRSVGRGGGLEHSNSTALLYPRYNFRPESVYHNFLSLVAHEFFHAWNVKRIRPDALGPFDYTAENYTRLLWVAEGLTSYYDELLLRRASLASDKEFLRRQADLIEKVQNTPGRFRMSAEEASFDAWIKYYRPDENSINSEVSYYDKGALIGLLLDLEIRGRTNGARSLDDVMRRLYNDYYKRGRNYTAEGFQKAAEAEANGSLEDFFARYVRGREELDYNAALAVVGLRLDTTGSSGSSRRSAGKTYLGATLAQEGERLVVKNVLAGTPAYEQGLSAGDQIVAIDNNRATLDFFNARIDERQPGELIRLTIFRQDDLRTLDLKLGRREQGEYQILPVSAPTEGQKRLYQGWLNAPFAGAE